MNEPFEIPVLYKGEHLFFPAKLLVSGYSYRIEADVKNEKIIFEPDEERHFRAIIASEKSEPAKVDPELLKVIAEAIEAIAK